MQRQVVLAVLLCVLHRTHGNTEATKNVKSDSDASSTKVKRGILNEFGGQIFLDQIPRQTIQPKPQYHFGSIDAYNSKYFAPQGTQYPLNNNKVALQQLNGLPQSSYGNRFQSTPHNIPQTAYQISPYQISPFHINSHHNNQNQNSPIQNRPVQNIPVQNSPYQNSPYHQHYINLQETPNYVIQNSPFSAALQQYPVQIAPAQQQRAPTVMIQTSQEAPGNHVRTEIISQTIVNTPRPVVHSYDTNNNFPLHMISNNMPNSEKDNQDDNADVGLITHHYSKPKQHVVYHYSTLPEGKVGKPAPARPASPIAKAPEQPKAVAPQYYKPQVFESPIVSQIQHFLPTPFPFSTIHESVSQQHSSKPNEGSPKEDIIVVPHNSPKVVSLESTRSTPQDITKNKAHDSNRNVPHDSGARPPHHSSGNQPQNGPRYVPHTSYERSRDVPHENTKSSPHDSSKQRPYENDSQFHVVDGPKEERHEMREKINAEMFHEEDNDEETFEKAYKNSARGFPAYYRGENAKSAHSFGLTPYEASYGGNYDYTAPHSGDKGSSENTHAPYSYDSYEPGYKNSYSSEYAKYKPVPYESRDEKTKSHKSSEYKQSPQKQSQYSHEDKDSGNPNSEKHRVSGYTKTYSDSYTKPSTSHTSKYTQFVEPQYQYGFEPIVAEKSSNAPVWEDSEHAPNNMKKLYKENWYISKMSSLGAA